MKKRIRWLFFVVLAGASGVSSEAIRAQEAGGAVSADFEIGQRELLQLQLEHDLEEQQIIRALLLLKLASETDAAGTGETFQLAVEAWRSENNDRLVAQSHRVELLDRHLPRLAPAEVPARFDRRGDGQAEVARLEAMKKQKFEVFVPRGVDSAARHAGIAAYNEWLEGVEGRAIEVRLAAARKAARREIDQVFLMSLDEDRCAAKVGETPQEELSRILLQLKAEAVRRRQALPDEITGDHATGADRIRLIEREASIERLTRRIQGMEKTIDRMRLLIEDNHE